MSTDSAPHASPQLASHLQAVPPNQIREITQAAWKREGAVVLSIGEPGFPTAEHVRQAAIETYQRDETNYTPNGGLPIARRAFAHRISEQQGIDVDESRAYIVSGAQQGLHLAMSMMLDAGDEVLIPDPGYPTYPMTAQLVHARPVPYPLRPEHGFIPQVADLESAVTERTRAIVLNSPSNPLGAVTDDASVRAIMDFARRRNLWVLTDECYEAFTWENEHVSPLRYDTDGRVVVVTTLSKTYGLTGLRVGALIMPSAFDAAIDTVMEGIISCVNPAVQHAAVAAIGGPQDYVTNAATHYRENRDLAQRLLTEKGLSFLPAQGAFYLWVDVRPLLRDGQTVRQWCFELLDNDGVAFAPGTAFGPRGEGWVRIALCGSAEDLAEGISRLPSATG